jgi:type I restriction enzyme, S subunit
VSELPLGWKRVRLEDICQLVRGVTFPTTVKRYEYAPGAIACLRTTNVQRTTEWDDLWYIPEVHVKNEEQFVQETDILISTANSYELVGKVSWVGKPPVRATLGAFISLLRAYSGVDPAFLFSQMSSDKVQQTIREMASTTTNISNVSGAKLKELNVCLAPIAEQVRIVAKLEELLSDLDAGVAELKAAQAKLGQYRQSLLKAAVDGSLTAEWRKKNKPKESGAQLLERILAERRKRWEEKQLDKFRQQGKTPPKGWENAYPHPMKPDITNLPEMPEGWVWATVDQVSEFITSGSRGWAEFYSENGAVFIRSQNINKDYLDLEDIAFVDPPRGSEGARTRVHRNDLLLTITGANVGKTACVDVDLDEAYVSQHVALIRPLDNATCSYLHAYLTTKAGGRGQLDKAAYGAGKPGLNLTQVGSVSVPIPPMQEVTQILADLEENLQSISNQTEAISALLATSSAQRKNILKAAFSGQLVPQDPKDEPASVLLERIQSERAASASKGAKRGWKERFAA